MEGSITVENAVLIPLFTMVLMLLVSFNLYLHDRIDSGAMEIRRKENQHFSGRMYQPQEAIRAYQALKNVRRGENES